MLAPKNERMNEDPLLDASSDPSFPFKVGYNEITNHAKIQMYKIVQDQTL